jgi:hypothetical protein
MRSIEERAARVLEQARELAEHVPSATEFSRAVFDPRDGLAAQAFPTLRERREFTMTKPYAAIYDMLYLLMANDRTGDGDKSPSPVPELADGGRQRSWQERMHDQHQARAGAKDRSPE